MLVNERGVSDLRRNREVNSVVRCGPIVDSCYLASLELAFAKTSAVEGFWDTIVGVLVPLLMLIGSDVGEQDRKFSNCRFL